LAASAVKGAAANKTPKTARRLMTDMQNPP
jgi:hypothetical protein